MQGKQLLRLFQGFFFQQSHPLGIDLTVKKPGICQTSIDCFTKNSCRLYTS